jgi:hypothetical protein
MRVAVCVQGTSFSPQFLMSWTQFLNRAASINLQLDINISAHANPYTAVNGMLGGKDQSIFNGRDIHAIIWLNGKCLFNLSHITMLLSDVTQNSEVNIACGIHRSLTGELSARNLHDDPLSEKDIETYVKTHPRSCMEVKYSAFYCAAMLPNVFERLSYPWCCPIVEHATGEVLSPDFSLCNVLRNLGGEKIYVDPQVRVWSEEVCVV